MQEDFALRPSPPALPPMALEPMEMIMCDASPPSGLWLVPLPESQPLPIRTSRTSPKPLSLWTARHRRPSAVRVKVTFPITPFSLGSPSPLPTELSAAWRADWAAVFALRRVATEAGVAPVLVGPAPGEPASRMAGAAGPAAEPRVVAEPAASGVAVGAGLVPSPFDVVLTEVVPAVVGVEVVGVVCLATACPVAAGAWVVGGTRDWITAMLGFEPPLPPGATVVEVTGLTVVVVVAAAGAVVVGVVGVVVAGATVVALA